MLDTVCSFSDTNHDSSSNFDTRITNIFSSIHPLSFRYRTLTIAMDSLQSSLVGDSISSKFLEVIKIEISVQSFLTH